jgi:streptomycin 6-kinase
VIEHPGLAWLNGSASGRAWLTALPATLDACAASWDLTLGEPYPYAFASLAMPVTRVDGTPAVLKIQVPHREAEHEAAALALLGGHGAVRLLAHDPRRHALLLERCEPGTSLAAAAPDEALDVMIGLLPRLWVAAGPPFRRLDDEAGRWLSHLQGAWERHGRPFERSLLDAALDALRELPDTQGERVLVDQDLHADNVRRAQREPWLMIDPKPLVGERAFGLVPIVRGAELGEGPDALGQRLDRLTSELGVDRERTRRWALAQTLAWAFDEDEDEDEDEDADGPHQDQVAVARWLMHV